MTQDRAVREDAFLIEPAAESVAIDSREAEGVQAPSAAGSGVPVLAVVAFCVASVLIGVVLDHKFLLAPAPVPKIALAEQGSVVLDALLSQPNLNATDARRLVGESVGSVVRKYQSQGYLVVNANRGADSQLIVEALPASALDITDEMRAAVARAISSAADGASSSPASAPAPATPARTPANSN